MTVTQLVSRGPVMRAAVSASQLSLKSAVTGLCELWPCRHSRESLLAASMHSEFILSAVMEKGHLTSVDDLCPVLCPQKLSFLKNTAESPNPPGPHLLLWAPSLCLRSAAEAQGPRESPCQLTPNPRCSHTKWLAIMRSHDSAQSQKRPGLIKHVGNVLVGGNMAIYNHHVQQRNRPGMGWWLHAHA